MIKSGAIADRPAGGAAGSFEQLWTQACADVDAGRFERARETCTNLLSDMPAYGAVLFMLGFCERRLKNYTGSIDAFSQSMKIGGENAQNLFQMGCVWHDLGNFDEAAKWYSMALELEPEWAEAVSSLGNVLLFTSKQNAIENQRKALRLNPQLDGAAYHLATMIFEEGGLDECKFQLETALALNPQVKRARFFLGIIDWLQGNDEDAEAAMDQVRRDGLEFLVDSFDYMRAKRSERTRFFGPTPDVLAFALGNVSIDGLHLEFGVSSGNSTRFLAARTQQHIHGFDSFQGIPEAWAGLPEGSYTTLGKLPSVPENVTLHGGWFSDTLPAFMHENPGPVAFANIDCDLYSSTWDVLEVIGPAIVSGTILIFDEYLMYDGWRGHEYKAFQKFVEHRGLQYEYLAFGIFSKQAVVQIF